MFYWKITKLKVIISSIPLILISITDLILDVRFILFGPLAEIPKITIYAIYVMKVLPFLSQIRKVVHLLGIQYDGYLFTLKNILINWINNILIGVIYFILIYLIYSFIQNYFIKKHIK